MSAPRRRRAAALAAALVTAAAAVSGCVGLPEDGPVVTSGSEDDGTAGTTVSYVPKPPQPGESPEEIVRHFLDAMTAVPLQPSVARQFLSVREQNAWEPDRGIITYDETGPEQGTTTVRIDLDGANRLDRRGHWLGPVREEASSLRFPMVLEDGEWRIADAPDALVVPESWFAQQFRRVNLYFFDPSASVLVPEPVWLARGEQLATGLVRGLVAGPAGSARVTQGFLPRGGAADELVVVSRGGVADVSLPGDPASLTGPAREMALAQLAWTLRQDPSVGSFRLTVGGEPIGAPDGPTELSVDAYGDVDPTLLTASSQLFGIAGGRVVVASPEDDEEVTGPLGSGAYALRDLGVDLTAARVAAVSADGSAAWVSRLEAAAPDTEGDAGGDAGGAAGDEAGGEDPTPPAPAVTTYAGSGLLAPAWDHAGRLWLLERRGGRARLTVVAGRTRREVRAPGVTGTAVQQAIVSRDASRLVTVLDRPPGEGGDVVQVSRIRYAPSGRVLGVSRPRRLGRDGEPMRIRDIGWSSTSEVVVVNRLTAELTELRTLAVDASPASVDEGGTSDLLRERVLGVTSSPVESEPTYVTTPSGVLDPRNPDEPVGPFPEGLTALTYVG